MSSVPLIFSLPALMHAKVSEATPEVCVVKRFLDPGRARKTKAWLLMPFGAQCQVKLSQISLSPPIGHYFPSPLAHHETFSKSELKWKTRNWPADAGDISRSGYQLHWKLSGRRR
jgi:hypothetical protein